MQFEHNPKLVSLSNFDAERITLGTPTKKGWPIFYNGKPFMLALCPMLDGASPDELMSRYGLSKFTAMSTAAGAAANDSISIGFQLFSEMGQTAYQQRITQMLDAVRARVVKLASAEPIKFFQSSKAIADMMINEAYTYPTITTEHGRTIDEDSFRKTLYVKIKTWPSSRIKALKQIEQMPHATKAEVDEILRKSISTNFFDVSRTVVKGTKKARKEPARLTPVDESYNPVLTGMYKIHHAVIHLSGLFQAKKVVWQYRLEEIYLEPSSGSESLAIVKYEDEAVSEESDDEDDVGEMLA